VTRGGEAGSLDRGPGGVFGTRSASRDARHALYVCALAARLDPGERGSAFSTSPAVTGGSRLAAAPCGASHPLKCRPYPPRTSSAAICPPRGRGHTRRRHDALRPCPVCFFPRRHTSGPRVEPFASPLSFPKSGTPGPDFSDSDAAASSRESHARRSFRNAGRLSPRCVAKAKDESRAGDRGASNFGAATVRTAPGGMESWRLVKLVKAARERSWTGFRSVPKCRRKPDDNRTKIRPPAFVRALASARSFGRHLRRLCALATSRSLQRSNTRGDGRRTATGFIIEVRAGSSNPAQCASFFVFVPAPLRSARRERAGGARYAPQSRSGTVERPVSAATVPNAD